MVNALFADGEDYNIEKLFKMLVFVFASLAQI